MELHIVLLHSILQTNYYQLIGMDDISKPQMLLFSATVPEWVNDTARRYMNSDRERVDLVGKNKMRTAIGVEVRVASVHQYEGS